MNENVFQDVILPLQDENATSVIRWMQENNLLRREMKCEKCNEIMNWTKFARSGDGFVWKCQNKECCAFKGTLSIRKGSFFNKSKITLQMWLHAMFLWAEGIGVETATHILNLSRRTLVAIYNFFREICAKYFELNPIKIGGPGVIVQIDESCFSHKPKHHRGRAPNSQIWVFGIADTSRTPAVGYMEIVEKRDAATLLPIIERVIQKGSIIYSDEWKAYSKIKNLGFKHMTVNHSQNFVGPNTNFYTQNVESYWNKQKNRIRKMQGCRRSSLNMYLKEYMWRDRFSKNTFEALCHLIATQYRL